jgi:hypothetical protein
MNLSLAAQGCKGRMAVFCERKRQAEVIELGIASPNGPSHPYDVLYGCLPHTSLMALSDILVPDGARKSVKDWFSESHVS